MSLPWKSGQECLVVQCDRVTGEPVEHGHVIEALLAHIHVNADLEVVLTGPHEGWVATRFDASDAWNTYGRERTWRLMVPGDFEEQGEVPGPAWQPGDPVPEPPGHGYQEEGDY